MAAIAPSANNRFRPTLTVPLSGLLATLLIAHLLYGGFFPGPNGIGHDYAGGLPAMLADYYWSLNEGSLAAPWFTPAFCGGIPWFPDPGSMFYAFPSLFVRFLHLDPLTATYMTFMLFVGIGFVGAYLFSRRALGLTLQAALLAGVVFGLNGFFAHRMLVGHIGFHGIMLSPWLALVVASGPTSLSLGSPSTLWRVAAGAAVLAYWVHSGVQSLIVAFGLASAALIVLAWLRGAHVRSALLRSSIILPLGIGIAASKLVASFAYLGQFPRADYRLPGFGSLTDSLSVAFLALFANQSGIATFAGVRLQNAQWALDRHELEYGVTAVPLILLMVGFGSWLIKLRSTPMSWKLRTVSLGVLLLFVLTLPVLLNTYSPSWNEFLKSVPLIGSSSSLVRWFVIYVPILAIGAAALIDSVGDDEETRLRLAAVSLIVFVGLNFMVDRQFYLTQSYDPKPVVEAFRSAESQRGFRPQIDAIGAYVDQSGNVQLTANRNDTIVQNVSQLACYMPIFGYRLEYFPFKSLRTGPVLKEIDGVLNLKNPSCFVFPKENQCMAGDHFPTSRKADAAQFAAYRAFNFEKSARQKAADWLSGLSLAVLGLLMLLGSWRFIRQLLQR